MSEPFYTQIKPCPSCGKIAGWWSGLKAESQVIYRADGDKIKHLLFEKRRKHCLECSWDITHILEKLEP